MSFKSETTKRAEAAIKQKKMENKEMKNSTKKTVIVTVLTTLIIVVALIAQGLFFYNLGASQKTAYNNQVKSEASMLVQQLKPNK